MGRLLQVQPFTPRLETHENNLDVGVRFEGCQHGAALGERHVAHELDDLDARLWQRR